MIDFGLEQVWYKRAEILEVYIEINKNQCTNMVSWRECTKIEW